MNDLIIIDPKQYGLEKTKADEIAESFREPLAELAELETEYKNFENLTGTPPESTCAEAKALQQRYVKNRKSREGIHKTEKSYFLNAGRYVDAWKNKSLEVSKEREDKLKEIADYYVNIEKKRIVKLGEDREIELRACRLDDDIYIPPGLGEMPKEAWKIYLEGVQKKHADEMAYRAKVQAEQEAEEKQQQEEQERIRKENEQLKKESEAREKVIARERKLMDKKLQAEIKEREELGKKTQKLLEEQRAEVKRIEQEKADAEEAQRKAESAPDKEKIQQAIDYISAFPLIKVSTHEAQEIVEYAESKMRELCKWIFNELQEL